MHCRDHALQLHRARSEFEAVGVPLVLIGQATPRHAAHFRRRMGIDFPVLADESRETYRLAGAKVGTMAEVAGPRSAAVGAARIIRSGGKAMQSRVIGHAFQLGGAMIVTPAGRVAWSHMSEDATDNATPDEILAAARQALNG
jgi:peroxiredoxin